jgi:predicted DCC family thiol-disulfide oxidoreductase YuxK
MRRIVSELGLYLAGLGRSARDAWDRFFFTPADPTALGLIRVVTGLLLLRSLWVTGLDLHGFLGAHAWADPASVREWLAERVPGGWSFWLLVPDAMLRPAWVACLAVLALFTVGLFSRTTAVLAWAIAVSTARRAPVILYGFDQIVATWALYLAVSGASGQAVSLDRLIARWREARRAFARRHAPGVKYELAAGAPAPTVSANLGMRLIQLHLCLIYGMAALAKLRGDAWWGGFAIWGVLAAGEFRRFDLTALAAYPTLLNVMTHTGLFLELLYPVLIWVRPLRPLVLVLVVLLHVGIDLALGLTEFAVAMLAGNLAFVSGAWLRGLAAGRAADQPGVRVLYDGACPRCRASVAAAVAADPDRVVAPIDLTGVDVRTIHPSLTPEACLAAMHVVDRRDRVSVGYDGVTALARALPLFWPLGVLGALPGVAAVGRRLYNALAASRPREAACTDDACALPEAPAQAPAPPPSRRPAPPPGSPRR